MTDIIPSFYNTRAIGEHTSYDGFSNNLLRVGEVKRVIYPEDADSRSGKFIEYDVYVQHRENGTAVTKLYQNCFIANSLGSHADYDFRLLRIDKTQNKTDYADAGLGSKVLLLCINGANNEAVIISGIRDSRDDDKGRNKKGVHMDWEFNGVHVNISDDGGFSVEYKGPTLPNGKLDTSRGGKEASSGTKVEVKNDGTFSVSTKDKKQSVVIDHTKGTITVTGDKDLTLHANKIHIGADAGEKAVLGDTLVSLLGELCDALSVESHPTALGPSGPPINAAQYKAIKLRLKTALSQFITVKKTP